MGEVEFDRLLDAVRAAIAPASGDDVMLAQFECVHCELARMPVEKAPAKAANDNGPVWPLIPFPEGWYAAC